MKSELKTDKSMEGLQENHKLLENNLNVHQKKVKTNIKILAAAKSKLNSCQNKSDSKQQLKSELGQKI
jgi:hypothetical protein